MPVISYENFILLLSLIQTLFTVLGPLIQIIQNKKSDRYSHPYPSFNQNNSIHHNNGGTFNIHQNNLIISKDNTTKNSPKVSKRENSQNLYHFSLFLCFLYGIYMSFKDSPYNNNSDLYLKYLMPLIDFIQFWITSINFIIIFISVISLVIFIFTKLKDYVYYFLFAILSGFINILLLQIVNINHMNKLEPISSYSFMDFLSMLLLIAVIAYSTISLFYLGSDILFGISKKMNKSFKFLKFIKVNEHNSNFWLPLLPFLIQIIYICLFLIFKNESTTIIADTFTFVETLITDIINHLLNQLNSV